MNGGFIRSSWPLVLGAQPSGASTGAITVAGALDPETTAFYVLTVEASDGNGGTATALRSASRSSWLSAPTAPSCRVQATTPDWFGTARFCWRREMPWRATGA